MSLDATPLCDDLNALYAGIHKKPPVCTDSSLSSLAQEQLSLDGDTDSLNTSPSTSSLEAWRPAHKLVKTPSTHPHGLIRPPRKCSDGSGLGLAGGSGSSFSELEGAGDDNSKVSRSATDGEMRKALSSISHGVSTDSVYAFYGLTRPRPKPHPLLVSLDDINNTKRPPVSTWQRNKPDPNYAYSTKHLLYQRTCNAPKTSTPTSPPVRELPLAREKGKSCGSGVVGSWLFPPRRLKGRTAVSELNITYVVERSLYGHLNWTGLVRPVTLSKADRRWLLEDEKDANRKWASSMDRCTKRVLLRIQQKSVSVPGEQISSALYCTGGTD